MKHYGGLGNDSPENGKAAYEALVSGGTSGFNAVLGGNHSVDGKYERLEAHGMYWTASENGPLTAPFYNFGRQSGALSSAPGPEADRVVRALRQRVITQDSGRENHRLHDERVRELSQNFVSWNRIGEWLKRVDAVRRAAA